MKIKILNGIIIIDILTILLILAIVFIPSTVARIVLGLPFLLFFPGYMLVAALFARKDSLGGIEQVALSFGMSIAVTALIGLGLNYTPWGIRLEPVLYSISAFIFIMSIVAIIRRRQFGQFNTSLKFHLKLPGWEGSAFNKTLTVVLAIAILGAIGTLAYTVAFPKVGERFTEFYILGLSGKAADYPGEFVIDSNQLSVISVQYGDNAQIVKERYGRVILGIVDQEQKKTAYAVAIRIDGQPVKISSGGRDLSRLEGIVLEQGEKWEQEIGFAPLHTGDNQKVEFLLYKDGAEEAEESLHLWVDVRGE